MLLTYLRAASFLFLLHFSTAGAWASNALPSNEQLGLPVAASAISQAKLTVFFFDIYDASIIASPPFSADKLYQTPLALSLVYLRDFDAADINTQTEKELKRQPQLSLVNVTQMMRQLSPLMPDVRSGERLTASFDPSKGLSLWHGNQLRGTVSDLTTAKAFLDIWLGPNTSQPAMRKRLLKLN